jgi:putative ABC transport system ATP-binding protein
LSVRDNVQLADRLRGGATSSADELLAAVGLDKRANAFPPQLSGGETARAGLAVALAGRPVALFADEPTAEVSHSEERQLLELIRSLRPTDGGALIVTHSAQVDQFADRVLHLDEGRLVV